MVSTTYRDVSPLIYKVCLCQFVPTLANELPTNDSFQTNIISFKCNNKVWEGLNYESDQHYCRVKFQMKLYKC